MSPKKSNKRSDTLLFVDTNVLLDFYRVHNSPGGIELLDGMVAHQNLLISTAQVEMEYKKNRQEVIAQSLASLRPPEWSGLSAPRLIAGTEPFTAIAKAKAEIKTQHTIAREIIKGILLKPYDNDVVYKKLEIIFRSDSPFRLHREHQQLSEIRDRARRRFDEGAPPRKDRDTSIGDSTNWEWIITCAATAHKDVIIVTRDGDYGITVDGASYINDWLQHEFTERTGGRTVSLTTRLADAFKIVEIPVSEAAAEEERAQIATTTTERFGEAIAAAGVARDLYDRKTIDQLADSLRGNKDYLASLGMFNPGVAEQMTQALGNKDYLASLGTFNPGVAEQMTQALGNKDYLASLGTFNPGVAEQMTQALGNKDYLASLGMFKPEVIEHMTQALGNKDYLANLGVFKPEVIEHMIHALRENEDRLANLGIYRELAEKLPQPLHAKSKSSGKVERAKAMAPYRSPKSTAISPRRVRKK